MLPQRMRGLLRCQEYALHARSTFVIELSIEEDFLLREEDDLQTKDPM